MCAGRATRRAPGAFASDRRRTRALAARKARALEPKEQARPGDPLRTVALGWSRPFPRRRAGRDRLQYSRAIDQASRPHAQKRPLRGLGWRRGKLGRHRLADRNLQAERVDPYAYLAHTLTRIVGGHLARAIDELLPWAY